MPQDSCKGTPCLYDVTQLQQMADAAAQQAIQGAPAPIFQCSHPDAQPGMWDIKVVCHLPATTELVRSVAAPSIPPIGTMICVFPIVAGYVHWRVVDIEVYFNYQRAILHCVGDDRNVGEITTPKV